MTDLYTSPPEARSDDEIYSLLTGILGTYSQSETGHWRESSGQGFEVSEGQIIDQFILVLCDCPAKQLARMAIGASTRQFKRWQAQ